MTPSESPRISPTVAPQIEGGSPTQQALHLLRTTKLTYAQIARRTKLTRSSVCNLACRYGLTKTRAYSKRVAKARAPRNHHAASPGEKPRIRRCTVTMSWSTEDETGITTPSVWACGGDKCIAADVMLGIVGPLPDEIAAYLACRVHYLNDVPLVAQEDIQVVSLCLKDEQEDLARRLSAYIRSQHAVSALFLTLPTKESLPADAPVERRPEFLYVVRSPANGLIKIGFSTNPELRIQGLTTQGGIELETLLIREGTLEHEQELHRKFAAHRRSGEWFEDAQEIRNWIKAGARLPKVRKWTAETPAPRVKPVPSVTVPAAPFVLPKDVDLRGEHPAVQIARVHRTSATEAMAYIREMAEQSRLAHDRVAEFATAYDALRRENERLRLALMSHPQQSFPFVGNA